MSYVWLICVRTSLGGSLCGILFNKNVHNITTELVCAINCVCMFTIARKPARSKCVQNRRKLFEILLRDDPSTERHLLPTSQCQDVRIIIDSNFFFLKHKHHFERAEHVYTVRIQNNCRSCTICSITRLFVYWTSVEQETYHRIIVLKVSLAIEIGFLRIVVQKTCKLIVHRIILMLYNERKKITGWHNSNHLYDIFNDNCQINELMFNKNKLFLKSIETTSKVCHWE